MDRSLGLDNRMICQEENGPAISFCSRLNLASILALWLDSHRVELVTRIPIPITKPRELAGTLIQRVDHRSGTGHDMYMGAWDSSS